MNEPTATTLISDETDAAEIALDSAEAEVRRERFLELRAVPSGRRVAIVGVIGDTVPASAGVDQSIVKALADEGYGGKYGSNKWIGRVGL